VEKKRRAEYYGIGITIIKTKQQHCNTMVKKLGSGYKKRKTNGHYE
jgi:hypothetical protein